MERELRLRRPLAKAMPTRLLGSILCLDGAVPLAPHLRPLYNVAPLLATAATYGATGQP